MKNWINKFEKIFSILPKELLVESGIKATSDFKQTIPNKILAKDELKAKTTRDKHIYSEHSLNSLEVDQDDEPNINYFNNLEYKRRADSKHYEKRKGTIFYFTYYPYLIHIHFNFRC